jgi:hypothetical protein
MNTPIWVKNPGCWVAQANKFCMVELLNIRGSWSWNLFHVTVPLSQFWDNSHIFGKKNCADSNGVTTHGLNCRTPTFSCGKRKAPTNLKDEVSWKTVTWKKGLNFGWGVGWGLKLLTLAYWRITNRDLYVTMWKLSFLKTEISPNQHTKEIISN